MALAMLATASIAEEPAHTTLAAGRQLVPGQEQQRVLPADASKSTWSMLASKWRTGRWLVRQGGGPAWSSRPPALCEKVYRPELPSFEERVYRRLAMGERKPRRMCHIVMDRVWCFDACLVGGELGKNFIPSATRRSPHCDTWCDCCKSILQQSITLQRCRRGRAGSGSGVVVAAVVLEAPNSGIVRAIDVTAASDDYRLPVITSRTNGPRDGRAYVPRRWVGSGWGWRLDSGTTLRSAGPSGITRRLIPSRVPLPIPHPPSTFLLARWERKQTREGKDRKGREHRPETMTR